MLKKVQTVLPIVLLGLFMVASVAWGATAGVTSGTLLVSSSTDATTFTTGNPPSVLTSGINFISLGTIDVSKNLLPVTALDHVFIADNTGKNAGWSVKLSATPLTATVTDSTADGNVTITIPADKVLTAAASNLTPLFNSKPQAQVPSGSFSVGSTATNIMFANKGAGAGAYLADVNYTLSLPNYLPVGSTVTATSTSSAFKNSTVTDLGLFAGNYSTTITYSLSVAP